MGVLYVVLQNWQAEFPLNQVVNVKSDKKEYHHATIDSKGCLKTLIYKKVRTSCTEIECATYIVQTGYAGRSSSIQQMETA